MPVSKAQSKATNKYMRKNYDDLRIIIPKGRKEDVKALADARGESINSLVNLLLRKELSLTEEEWKRAGE